MTEESADFKFACYCANEFYNPKRRIRCGYGGFVDKQEMTIT